MKSKSSGCPRGFTLIEMIVTLVIVAVLGSMFYVYFGKGFTESVTPVNRLKQSTALHRVMQNITAVSNVHPQWRGGTIYTAENYVIPRNFNGFFYKCTTGGTSATEEPDWINKNSDGKVVDGTVRWTESGRLRDLVPLYSSTNPKNLKQRIGDEGSVQSTTNDYCKNSDGTHKTYTVVKNRFVRFVNDVEQDDTSGSNYILKVTLQNENGETLTSLFLSD